MKTLVENKTYTVQLNPSDENVGTCTYLMTSSRPDIITITNTATPNIFNIIVNEIGEENAFVEFYYQITDEESNITNTTEHMIVRFNNLPFDVYFNSLSITSITYGVGGRVDSIEALSGERLDVTYDGELVSMEKYYAADGINLILTITYAYDGNDVLIIINRT